MVDSEQIQSLYRKLTQVISAFALSLHTLRTMHDLGVGVFIYLSIYIFCSFKKNKKNKKSVYLKIKKISMLHDTA